MNIEIRQLPLSLHSNRTMVSDFLAANGLRLEAVDYYAGVFDSSDDTLVAGGGLCGNLMKCIAVDSSMRNEQLSGRLVSHLISVASSEGYDTVRLLTKPENKEIFASLGFDVIASAPEAIFMENGISGIAAYRRYLSSLKGESSDNGIVVMNANPFTSGHRYLIEKAAAMVARLFVIVVREDVSKFSYHERKAMITKGCEDLKNVVVCDGSSYSISLSTFPTYFLKRISDATDTQIAIDLDVFARHIAPSLNAKKRFVGTEPVDMLTQRYNEMMKTILPSHGIEVVEVERLSDDSGVVSASMVRSNLTEGCLSRAISMAYRSSIPYIIASLAPDALMKELSLTPKPGLVDRHDSGAHKDMDYLLMKKSIDSLRPFFTKLAVMAFTERDINIADVIQTGLDAEKAMFLSTGGVNTHKGALFSLGIVTCAASHVICREMSIQEQSLRDEIKAMARRFPMPKGTHGDDVVHLYNKVEGALCNARGAYRQLFGDWLPFYRQCRGDEFALYKTLLRIMTTLDDTNIYYRNGSEAVADVRRRAAILLGDFSLSALSKMNDEFIISNTSPGGCADMLSLTIFIDTLLL
jgi:[citrate (pro-3S)-lyase] ligase